MFVPIGLVTENWLFVMTGEFVTGVQLVRLKFVKASREKPAAAEGQAITTFVLMRLIESAGSEMILIIFALLFAPFESTPEEETFATLVIVPGEEFVTTIVIVAAFALLSVPILHVTSWPTRVQVPTVDAAEP